MTELTFTFTGKALVSEREWRSQVHELRTVCASTNTCAANFSVEHLTAAFQHAEVICTAEHLGRFVGFALIELPRSGSTVHMSTLFAMHAGRGIVEAVAAWGAHYGKKYLTVDSTPQAALFYVKIGFKFHAPRVYRFTKKMQQEVISWMTKYNNDPDFSYDDLKAALTHYACWDAEFETLAMALPLTKGAS